MAFKLKDKVVIKAIPEAILATSRFWGKQQGKQVTIEAVETRTSGRYYLIQLNSKQAWLPEANLQLITE